MEIKVFGEFFRDVEMLWGFFAVKMVVIET
jgi:hypothetical protein